MKKFAINLMLILLMSMGASAQRITRQYNNVSFSSALKDLNDSQNTYSVNFVYNELEDFKVTKSICDREVPDAIKQLIGFYPIRMVQMDSVIVVDCTQKAPAKMIGRIVDAHRQPVDFANVSLLSLQDSSFINGGVTNENGQFVIPCEAKKAFVKVSCVGYETVCKTYDTGKIGTITLNDATMKLQTVVVKGHRKTFEMTNEGLVTQVTGTPLSEAGTANDVIAQVPSVYGSDGTFSVYGKGEAVVYVNGRKVTDNTELERISSKDIASVVLDNNPGGKYESTVKAVIMVKTVKKQGDGLSGNWSAMFRQGHSLSTQDGGNLNWRKGGLDIFGSLYYVMTQTYQRQVDDKTTWNGDDVWQMHSDVHIYPRNKVAVYSMAGFNYAFNGHHSIGARYNMNYVPHSKIDLPQLQTVAKNGEQQENIDYDLRWDRRYGPAHIANAYYKGEVGKWSISFDNDIVARQDKAVQDTKVLGSQSGESTVNSTSVADNLMLASKLVVSRPVGKGTIEAGGEFIYTDRKQTYTNEEQIIASTDDHIKESKYAGFLAYNVALGKVRMNAGVRYEHTVSNYYEHEVLVAGQSRNYDKLFPNVGVAFPIGKTSLMVDYSMKTRRPSYDELSSNMSYDDAFTYDKGNPLLRPEIIHDVTMSGIYRWVYLNVGYQHISDAIVSSVESQSNNGQPLNIFTNVNKPSLNKYTATLSLTPRFGIWSPRLSMTLAGQDLRVDYHGGTVKMTTPILYASLYNYFSLPHDYTLSLDVSGNTRGDDIITTLKPSWQLGVGIVKKLNRWTFQLQATDVFRTARNSEITYGTGMYYNKWNYSDTQAVKLIVSYRFNAADSKYKGTGAGNAEKDRL